MPRLENLCPSACCFLLYLVISQRQESLCRRSFPNFVLFWFCTKFAMDWQSKRYPRVANLAYALVEMSLSRPQTWQLNRSIEWRRWHLLLLVSASFLRRRLEGRENRSSAILNVIFVRLSYRYAAGAVLEECSTATMHSQPFSSFAFLPVNSFIIFRFSMLHRQSTEQSRKIEPGAEEAGRASI